MNKAHKPLGIKNYGSIPHLPNSRMGPGDHSCSEGHARIATERVRDKNDEVFVQEKLDGSNVGIARVGDDILALGRAGYLAQTSPYEQHQLFAAWVREREGLFRNFLKDGERLVGEWLAQAHGTRYQLRHAPFVVFDLMVGHNRLLLDQLYLRRIRHPEIVVAALLHRGGAINIQKIMETVAVRYRDTYGWHGAIDPVEGAVWRIERNKPTGKKGEKVKVVDFLVKYVRPDKVDGRYLSSVSGKPDVWNWRP